MAQRLTTRRWLRGSFRLREPGERHWPIRGTREAAVARLLEKALLLQDFQRVDAGPIVQAPEAPRLRNRQSQAWHFEKLAADALQNLSGGNAFGVRHWRPPKC